MKIHHVFWLILFLGLPAQAQLENRSLQVEGLILGAFPRLGDGLHVSERDKRYFFEPAHRCLDVKATEKAGVAFSGLSFSSESRISVRNKMTGVIGYPGFQTEDEVSKEKDWMISSQGLAMDFFRDNLARAPAMNVRQVMFMPMVLSPEPVFLSRTDWTPDAKQILQNEGWEALKKFCGSHLVMAIGEENFVVYSLRATFNSEVSETPSDYVVFGKRRQSPILVLEDLYRMRERMEFEEGRGSVTVDVLQVGGRPEDVTVLRSDLTGLNISFSSKDIAESSVTRATVTCTPRDLERCQKFTQVFLDYQFGRLNFSGAPQNFAPVRFRLVPFDFVKNYMM